MKRLVPYLVIALVFAIAPQAVAQGTTTVAEILAQRDTTTPDVRKPRYCNGGVFRPCVCWGDVSKRIMYRPSVRECGGNAAVILHGRYADSFSAVLRNIENADRIPNPKDPNQAMVNGCTRELANSVAPPNRCSVFKAQRVLRFSDERGNVAVHCLGTRGNSRFGRTARRITVKISDIPNSSNDPLVRACLRSPLQNLN